MKLLKPSIIFILIFLISCTEADKYETKDIVVKAYDGAKELSGQELNKAISYFVRTDKDSFFIGYQ